MRIYEENCEDTLENIKNLNAKEWQVEMIKTNPEYPFWGNYEDYMTENKSQWGSRVEFDTWEDFGPWELNELNELVNFYFEITRDSKDCPDCTNGLNKETQKIQDEWYDHGGTWIDHPTNPRQRYNPNVRALHLEQYEIDALWESGRLNQNFKEKPTFEQMVDFELNEPFGHDSINAWICVKARAKHLGVYGECPTCEGKAYIHTSPEAKLGLQLWWLHPRKGASRGIYIKEIKENQINEVIEFLEEAQKRNNDRFSKISNLKKV